MISFYSSVFCIICIILSFKFLSSPKSAVTGGILGALGMTVAIIFDFYPLPTNALLLLVTIIFGGIIGIIIGYKVKITQLPQMVAAFNGLGGGAAVCISFEEISGFTDCPLTITLGCVIGAITFSGSAIAFCKLQGLLSKSIKKTNFLLASNILFFLLTIAFGIYFHFNSSFANILALAIIASAWGVAMVIPIGGADMPIVISILNSFSGWASVAIGFSQQNILMVTVGTIIGISGGILAIIMTKSMNRSVKDIFFLSKTSSKNNTFSENIAATGSPQDAAFIMQNSQKVIIVPGFGMAAASAQHALKTMSDLLQKKFGVNVKYAIHPVAGRMPGHMNVLLAEANVNYNDVYQLEDINREFSTADVAYVIGANDITNPEAKNNPSSPLYGMPILEVSLAKTVFFVKRSLNTGYSGAENPLFFAPNTYMLYGDAKKVTEEIDKYLEQSA